MKAVILERRGDYAALLCEDGTFVNRRVAGEIGETVELTAEVVALPQKRKHRWMRSAVAAALALAVTGGTLGYMGGTASAYVSLDVDEDSAIELTVNHFGRVIAVNALSDDTAELAKALTGEVRHKKPTDALEHTMKRLREEGYLGEQDAAVVAGVTSDNAGRAAELKQSVENAVGEGTELYVSETSRDERRQAMDDRRSAGRFAFERDHGEAFAFELWGEHDKSDMEHPAPRESDEGSAPAVPASPSAAVEENAPPKGVDAPQGEPEQPDEQRGIGKKSQDGKDVPEHGVMPQIDPAGEPARTEREQGSMPNGADGQREIIEAGDMDGDQAEHGFRAN